MFILEKISENEVFFCFLFTSPAFNATKQFLKEILKM